MAIEAEIISVSTPGQNVDVLVLYRDGGVEVAKETIPFGGTITADIVTNEIKARGKRIQISKSNESLAKTLIGQKIAVPDSVEAVPDATGK